MEGTGSVQKFWLFITPVPVKFTVRWKRFKSQSIPPLPAPRAQAEAASQTALGGRMARFVILTFSMNLLGPLWWHLTMSGTDIPGGMKPMDPCSSPICFSSFKQTNKPHKPLGDVEHVSPSSQAAWHTPEHSQTAYRWWTRPLWAQRYLQCLPMRQCVPPHRGHGLLHSSRLSWQHTSSQSLQPKIPPNKSPSEKEQPPNSKAPQQGHQQNARHLFWIKRAWTPTLSKQHEQKRDEHGSLQSVLQQGGRILSSLAW